MNTKYNTHFLDQVVVRIDFSSELSEIKNSLPSEITDTALKYFPLSEPKKYIKKKVELTLNAPSKEEVIAEGMEWRFYANDRNNLLSISPDWVYISYKKYDSFEVLKKEFLEVIGILFKLFEKEIVVSRLGLRYINNIVFPKGNPFDWKRYLIANLLPILKVPPDQSKISRAFHNLTLNYGDMNLIFQYGLYNPDFPAPIRKRNFVLDFDASWEGSLNESEMNIRLDRFHDEIQNMFEMCITDNLRKEMNK